VRKKATSLVMSILLGAGWATLLLVLINLAASPTIARAVGETIEGRVHSDLGVPEGGALVRAERVFGGPGFPQTVADPNGFYTLTLPGPGIYRVGATKFGFATEYYPNEFDLNKAALITVQLSANIPGIDFFLDPGGDITGTVKDLATGQPITSAHVSASPAGGAPWAAGAMIIDASGVYTLMGVPVGQYKVRADAPGYDPSFYNNQPDWAVADVIEVMTATVTGPIDFLLKESPKGAIAGSVVLPNGIPVPNAWVDAELLAGLLPRGAQADLTGNFTVTGLITGTWRLRAHPPVDLAYIGYSASRDVVVTLTTESLLVLTKPLTLTTVNVAGRAVLPDGSPAGGSGVYIHTLDFAYQTGMGTGPDGIFRVGGLPTGTYAVDLFPPWNMPDLIPPDPVSFTLTDRNDFVNLGNITFTLASKHISATVVYTNGAGVPNVDVNAIRRGQPGWAHALTDDGGQAGLNVGAGQWEVMISAPPDGSANWIYPGLPKLVTFAEDDTPETQFVTFTVETADAWVTGRVFYPNCADPVPPQGVGVEVRRPDGRGNHAPLSPGGYFTVPVVAGTYGAWILVDEQLYPNLSGPQIPPFEVASGQPRDLGDICLIEKTSGISGRVHLEDGSGVPGVRVHAWKHEGGWASGETDAEGSYFLSVFSGTWEVNVELPISSTLIPDQHEPRTVVVGDDEIATGIDFLLLEAAGVIHGMLVDQNGSLLTDVEGWAYARPDGANTAPVAGGPVRNGEFSINVPHGTYRVGLWLPPNSGYTVSGEQTVGPLSVEPAQAQTRAEVAAADMAKGERATIVAAGTTVSVTFTLLPNDALIVGGFFLDGAKTTPAVGLEGEVFAMGGIGGAWRVVPINPANGRYTMTVASGTWNVGYHLRSADYVNTPPPNTRVTIASTEVFTFNFTVVAADSTIEGHILDPNGDPLNAAFAWAHRNRSETSAAIDTGGEAKPPDAYFRIRVPSGGRYHVGAFAPLEFGYIQPDAKVVTPTTGGSVSVTLRFKDSNGVITGTVYYHDQAGNSVYGPFAWVWAWSDDGQHTGAPTDANGQYRLNVVTGTTWHVGAAYHPEQGSLFYRTITPTTVVMDSTPKGNVDLDIYLARTALPPAIADTFDPSVGWTGVLSDGTRIEIPAGAMPTTDTVRISVTPLVEELPNTLSARPFGYGYAIVAYEDSTGNQIVSNFNSNVLITFYYTEDELRELGVTEDNEASLSPAYFSTTTNSWTKVESYTVDTTNNRITAQINHFSRWTLTAPVEATTTPTTNLYLPLVMRN